MQLLSELESLRNQLHNARIMREAAEREVARLTKLLNESKIPPEKAR